MDINAINVNPQTMRKASRFNRLQREAKRRIKQAGYHAAGLNGARAVARRQAQMERTNAKQG